MNIEKTISEHAVSDILTPMLESQDRIVTEDVAPLFDQATGLDTPPASGTVTTTIEESRSVITAIIRKAWTATLTMLCGASVIGYIAAAYTYLRNRLQGNETYGIPDRRSEITASSPLAANLALLNDRKIGGVPEAVDGISLVQLICSAASSEITELTDSTSGWLPNKSFFTDKLASLFANLSTVTINCKEITTAPYEVDYWGAQVYPNYSIIYGEGVERIYTAYAINKKDTDTFVLPKVKTIAPFKTTASGNIGTPVLSRAKNILALELEEWCLGTYNACGIQGNELRKFYAPKLKGISRLYGDDANGFVDTCPYLIHLEVGEGFVGWYGWEGLSTPRQISSVNFKKWEATMALRTDTDAEDYVELREDMSLSNNLEQFLSNFRDYIALRLTDNGSGKTLTLSQAVRNAIHAAEATYGIENIIITQKGWTISPAPN